MMHSAGGSPGTLLIVAPHADDETLGAGGTLLRRRQQGWQIHWLLVTDGLPSRAPARVAARAKEIEWVAAAYGCAGLHQLGLPAGGLDQVPEAALYGGISDVVRRVEPSVVLLPHAGDPHSEHRRVHEAVWACTKSFRCPWVRQVIAYEVPSETDFATPQNPFTPNCFVDITHTLEAKLKVMQLYNSEMGEFPFPRSARAISARATVHGVVTQTEAAEAFMVLRSIDKEEAPRGDS